MLHQRFIRFGLLATLCVAGGALSAEMVIEHDWGPFYSEMQDVHGRERERFLGPMGEFRKGDAGNRAFALRPFYHRSYETSGDVTRSEFLWPLAVGRTRGERSYARVLLNFYWNWDRNDPASAWRLWILPFYFQGRDHDGEEYMALFPLLGSIHGIFTMDEINFALWPLWVESWKDDLNSKSILWPFTSVTTGEGIRRFRIFPFYGTSLSEGQWRKTFILWPFFNFARYTLPGASGTGWILFPLTGHLKLTNQETWWLLPPLFRYSKGEQQNMLLAPWPFFQKEEGVVDKMYLFPVYGHKEHAGMKKWFVLWPLGHAEIAERPLETKKKFFFVPFVQKFSETPNPAYPTEQGKTGYLKVWPLFQHSSAKDGADQELRIFDLNPMRGGPIERNYAPFWQVFTRSQVGENVDTEILWGMYRASIRGNEAYRSLFPLFSWSRENEGGHFSLLKGLLSRRRNGEQIQWRLLYLFKFGAKENDND